MVYDRLHQDILNLRWEDCVSTLATKNGKAMAREAFKMDLPLHMACERQAPDTVILDLLGANPDAVMTPGKHGNLPLHLAAQQRLSLDIVKSLIKAYPEGLDELNSYQCTPRDYPQRNEKLKEAFLRPTSCWVESVEREQYYTKKRERMSELKNKAMKLRAELEQVRNRRQETTEVLSAMEVRVEDSARIVEAHNLQMQDVLALRGNALERMDELNKRLNCFMSATQDDCDYTEALSLSNAKREHVVTVSEEYAKALSTVEELKKEVIMMKIKARLNMEALPTRQ